MWRTIDSAPRDGRWLIAWDGERVLPLCWVEADPDWGQHYTGWAWGDERWGGTLYDGVNEVKRQPTRWWDFGDGAPLPAPPADGE